MSTRTLFLPVTPVEAYLVVRERSIKAQGDSADVVLLARRGHRCWGGQLLAAQCLLDPLGGGVQVAAPAAGPQRGLGLGQGEPGPGDGVGGSTQHGQGVPVVQVIERDQRSGLVLPQRVTQPVGLRERDQIRFWWARAMTLMPSAAALSPAMRRWLCASVRTRSASIFASVASDFAPLR